MSDQYQEHVEIFRRMRQWKMAFLGLVILVAGVVIGSGFTVVAVRARFRNLRFGVEFIKGHTVRQLRDDLELTDDQSKRIEEILDGHVKAMDEIREAARPKIAEEMNQLHQEVMAILDERQKDIWQEKIERLGDRFTHPQRPGGGPGPHEHYRRRPFDHGQEQPPGDNRSSE